MTKGNNRENHNLTEIAVAIAPLLISSWSDFSVEIVFATSLLKNVKSDRS
jgi:hypothetical protein